MSARSLFISDLHLEAGAAAVPAFFAFLERETPGADALYILGDLFESWIGDDHEEPLMQQVANALHQVAARGTQVYFMVGNRDFLLGPAYAQRCSMQLLTDPCRIELYGVATLLLHGDTLCTADLKYQAFRAQVRNPHVQQAFLAQSIEQRQAYAAQVRAASQSHTGMTDAAIMDVTPELIEPLLAEHQVQRIIHGHTHRPQIHRLTNGERVVLGDWYQTATWLEVTPTGITEHRQTLA